MEIRGLCPLLGVFDMPRSVRFYCDNLGFEIHQRSATYSVEDGVELFHWAWLKRDDAELMLNTAYDEGERPNLESPMRIAAHQDTTLYLGCPEVDGAYEELKAKGVSCKPPQTAWYGMRQLEMRDPDGFGVVLQWRAK